LSRRNAPPKLRTDCRESHVLLRQVRREKGLAHEHC
jgi:hypothetical protein